MTRSSKLMTDREKAIREWDTGRALVSADGPAPEYVPMKYIPITSRSQLETHGVKHDKGKLRWDLIPVGALEKVAEVYTIGSKKYDDRNWEKGIAYMRIYRAMLKHLFAWVRGETVDPDDGQHPLASVVWGALALMTYENTHREMDDRPIPVRGVGS